MLTYFPVPAFAEGLCGVAYALDGGPDGASLVLPALMPQLQVCLAGAIAMRRGDGPFDAAPPFSIMGATHTAYEGRLSPGARVIGVGLLARGWRDVVGESGQALADLRIEGAALWGDGAASRLLDAMASSTDNARAARLLFRFVADRALLTRTDRMTDVGADWRLDAVDAWLAQTGALPIDTLVGQLGLSRRQVERLTARHYAATPKLLELKYKSLRLAAGAALGQLEPGWAEEAPELFYDQSHRIKNFRRFVGWTPAQFQREQAGFSRTMLIGRWNAGARTAMALWS